MNKVINVGLLAALTCGSASALEGGGVTPIGAPFGMVDINSIIDPIYDGSADCDGAFVCEAVAADSGNGRTIDHEYSFNNHDRGHVHSDPTGVFWADAERVALLPEGENRMGVQSNTLWVQEFRKDTSAAWLKFVVSSAYLEVGGLGAASATLSANGTVAPTDGYAITQHDEYATLRKDENGTFETFVPQGPLVFSVQNFGLSGKRATAETYVGYLDISQVPKHGTFSVTFQATAIALSGDGENPVARAFYRDPLSSGGGFTIETEGLTALNNPRVAPAPADRAAAQIIQADGKIVTAGYAFVGGSYDFALARYNSDGSLDMTFGDSGRMTTDFSAGDDRAEAIALQSDGKIVVAGVATDDNGRKSFALARYDAQGHLDQSFGNAGLQGVQPLRDRDSAARAVVVESTGNIVVAGQVWNGANYDFAVARLDTDGGSRGGGTLDFAGGSDLVEAIAVQSDGKLILAGHVSRGSGVSAEPADFGLVRLNADGSVDTTFGSGGKVITDFNEADDFAQAVAVQSDGKIVVAGHSDSGSSDEFALVRYDSSGRLDESFGDRGKTRLDFGGSDDLATAVAIQADGKLVLGGSSSNGTHTDFALARFLANGSVDAAFGSSGKALVDFAGNDDAVAALSIQPDGKIVAAGYAVTDRGDDFALARLNP